MKPTLFFLLCLTVSATRVTAQLDTLFTTSAGVIACSVKEVEPEVVKFTYPNEEVVNSLYKNSIRKIVFRSGRVQAFAEALALKTVTGAGDYAKVGITQAEYDVRGLYRLGELTTRAKAMTGLTGSEAVKERAYQKLKMEAAMYGANIVYLAVSSTTGSEPGKTTETNLTGIAYSNAIPDFEEFKKKLGSGRQFHSTVISKFSDEFSGTITEELKTSVEITEVFPENGLTILKAYTKRFGAGRYRLIHFDDNSFTVMFKKGGVIHNLRFRYE